jgi:hypothetical protein
MVLRGKGTPGTGDFRRAAAPSSACECGSASMLPTPEATVMVQTNRRLCPFPDGGCTEQPAKAVSQSPPGSRRGGLPHHEQPGGKALCLLAPGCLLVCPDTVSGSTRPRAGPSRVRSRPWRQWPQGWLGGARSPAPPPSRVPAASEMQGHSAFAPEGAAVRRATPLRSRLPRARTSESAWFRSKRSAARGFHRPRAAPAAYGAGVRWDPDIPAHVRV